MLCMSGLWEYIVMMDVDDDDVCDVLIGVFVI